MTVVDPVAVTKVAAVLSAEPPDRDLQVSREELRESRVEAPGINLAAHLFDDVSAPAWLVAAWPVAVFGPKPSQDPCPVHPGMNEGVDHDHARAGGDPAFAFRAGPE